MCFPLVRVVLAAGVLIWWSSTVNSKVETIRSCINIVRHIKGYSYGQPPHDIASLLLFMLWRSGTHHENRLDVLVQDMQGNKWNFYHGRVWVKKGVFSGCRQTKSDQNCGGKVKHYGGKLKKIWREIFFLVVVCKNIFFIFVKFDLLPNGFVPSSTRAID